MIENFNVRTQPGGGVNLADRKSNPNYDLVQFFKVHGISPNDVIEKSAEGKVFINIDKVAECLNRKGIDIYSELKTHFENPGIDPVSKQRHVPVSEFKANVKKISEEIKEKRMINKEIQDSTHDGLNITGTERGVKDL